MPFIGNQPAESYSAFQKQDFSTSATTSYTLDHPVANQNEIALFINFVRQEPTTAYTASGTSLTLTSATSASDDMYCVYLGKAVQTVNPPSGSVGSSQVAASIITGQTAETSIATDDTVLIHDTSAGALRKMTRANFVSGIGGANTPYFRARRSSNQNTTSGAATKIQFDTEEFDTGNEYDNSTNYRFTPANGNTYCILVSIGAEGSSATTLQEARIALYKNGSELIENRTDPYSNSLNKINVSLNTFITGNGSDYYEVYANLYVSSGTPRVRTNSSFAAFKLIT